VNLHIFAESAKAQRPDVANVEDGFEVKVQLFAYYKISRQPAFQDGDTTAPIFMSHHEESDGRDAVGCGNVP
jgi:hypothetical protein